MSIEEIDNSKAFEFKNIPSCWVITINDDEKEASKLVFDIEILCHDLKLDFKEVLRCIDNPYDLYRDCIMLRSMPNPFYVKGQPVSALAPKKHKIDFSVMMEIKQHFGHVN